MRRHWARRHKSPAALPQHLGKAGGSGGGRIITARSQIGAGPLPDGGMVFLDGGRIAIAGASTRLAGARLAPCRTSGPCLVTAAGVEYRLPFADAALFGEVLWRVEHGTNAFYLSINPRKRMLRADFPIESVPAGRLRFGPGRGGAEALNEVVTAGGIERSRIGDILWRADVAFKSKSLGVDALTGTRLPADARLFVSDEGEGPADDDVAEGDRWCRLYWGSGEPTFTFLAPTAAAPGRIAVGGAALKARAEAMRPVRGSLQRFPLGGWCAREKVVASLLQRQANLPASAGTLGELRTLAQMQSFALWAGKQGVTLTALAAAPVPITPIPGWTSGIRTASVTLVKPERRILPDSRGYMIHVWSSAAGAFGCRDRTWAQLDQDFTRLDMPKHNGKWVIVPIPAVYAKLDTWLGDASQRIARCAGGKVEPVLDNADIELGKSGAILGMKGHSLSSQLHGGVLLGETAGARAFAQAYGDDGALWAPDGTLLFKRIGEALHFWNPLPGGRGAQHVVVTRGTLREIEAKDGSLYFAVDARPGAAIRSDLRVTGGDAGAGLEWMGLWHGADGIPLAGKLATRCAEAGAATGCIDVHDADGEALFQRLRAIGIEDQPIDVTHILDGRWGIMLNIARLATTLRPPAGADADARIAAAGELGRWGLRAEAGAMLTDALLTLSPDAEDTILRSLIVAGDQ